MKKNLLKRLLLISLLVLVSITSIACGRKDKQKIISNNVSIETEEYENLIKKNIEVGNNYLKNAKYDLAKLSYEKAISLDIGNKQTYLTIKDKYLEKGRLDDAYYIIKLAVKNNADTANMNKILAEISGKLDTTNIKKYLQQNNKYTLPNEVTMKIDGVDKKIFVKWNNSSAIDTSKAGDFTYEGNSEQYGRKVKLVLYVTSPIINNKNYSELEAYKAVLQNKVKFLSTDNKKKVYLNEFLTNKEIYGTIFKVPHFTVLDMDGDKIPEVVLELTQGDYVEFYEVFHYMKGEVYGYIRVLRGLERLKMDGTFSYANSAFDTGYGKLRFKSNACETDFLAGKEANRKNDSMTMSYFINNKSITKESYMSLSKEENGKKM